MTMTNEQIQALRASCVKAGGDEWQAKKISGDFYVIRKGSYKAECGFRTYEPIAEVGEKSTRDFIAAANPAAILSLLAEREADKALIAKAQADATQWKELVDAFCSDEVEWHKLTNSNNELISSLSTLICKQADRIAELEARTLTVKLPERCECCYSEQEAAMFDGVLEEVTEALESACAAAGITLKVGGEDAPQ